MIQFSFNRIKFGSEIRARRFKSDRVNVAA